MKKLSKEKGSDEPFVRKKYERASNDRTKGIGKN